MIRPAVLIPDPVLSTPTRAVEVIDDEVLAVVTDMLDTMREAPGCVGLAANQIGVPLRIFCIDVTGHKKARSCHGELTLVNPELLVANGPEVAREGCMSVPDLTGNVARATEVVVRGLDPSGAERVIHADAFEARALLHELDHLEGKVFLDRVTSASEVFRRKVFKR